MQNWFAECGASMRAFWLEDQGQDLIEYTLLLAFVAWRRRLCSSALAAASNRSGPPPTRSWRRPPLPHRRSRRLRSPDFQIIILETQGSNRSATALDRRCRRDADPGAFASRPQP